MKCRDRKRRYQLARQRSAPDVIARRKARLEAEVLKGVRDAATLVAIPAELVRRATVAFPSHPFGEPEPW